MTLASLLFSCFPSRPATQPLLPTQPVPDPASPIKVRECVFCELTENGIAGPEKIRYEDGAWVVFRDRSQGAEQHLLVIPKGHVAVSVKDLSEMDVPLLRRMKQLGEETLLKDSTSSSPTFKFGFHIPPFTSVAHIHLHAFQLPHSSASAKVEFRSTRRSHERLGKSFGWFVELDQVIDILEAGKKVTVKSCAV